MLSSQNRELFCDCITCEFGHVGKMMRMCNGDNDSSKREQYREVLAQPERASVLIVPEDDPVTEQRESMTHAEVMRGMKTKEERAAYRASLQGG